MKTAEIERRPVGVSRDIDFLELPAEALVCDNCGFWAANEEVYLYHAEICLIPA
jgi:hypothetical protein